MYACSYAAYQEHQGVIVAEDFEIALRQLREVEASLSQTIAAYPERPEMPYSREGLVELRNAVDRLRPLLWIYLNQAAGAEGNSKSPVDDCLEITNKVLDPHLRR